MRQELYRYMYSLLEKVDSPAIIIGGVTDHIHILFVLEKNRTLSELMRSVKASSSGWLKRKGVDEFAWQNGYAAFSVNESLASTVKKYIVRQAEHHQKFDFQGELQELLMRHNIDFDERYLWD